MRAPPAADGRSALPRRFPTWPGLLAGLAVGGLFAGADALGLLPPACWAGSRAA